MSSSPEQSRSSRNLPCNSLAANTCELQSKACLNRIDSNIQVKHTYRTTTADASTMDGIRSQVVSVRYKPVLLPLFCLISPANANHSKSDGGSTCHICGNTYLEGLVHAEFEIPEAGTRPVPHRACCARRNSSGWGQHHRSLGEIPPASSPPSSPRQPLPAGR